MTERAVIETWVTPAEALRFCAQRHLLRRTVMVALIVGVLLSAVNQATVFVDGEVTGATWLRIAANFVIPFLVSNVGALSAARSTPRSRPFPPEV